MKTTKALLTMTMLAALFLNSCKDAPKQKDTATPTTENTVDNIVKTSATDKDGVNLDIEFNNKKGIATIHFKGETIELLAQKSASGFWYKNEQYELRGKGNDIELKKDDTIVFTHQDEIITSSLKDTKGQTLDITFNNTTNSAKIYLNGGEQIELMGQNPASGIWYKNNTYELRGKEDDIELTKDGKIVFKTK